MKRTVSFFLLAFCAIAVISAQTRNRQGQDSFQRGPAPPRQWERGEQRRTPRQNVETVNVSGNLTITQGMISVSSNDSTYLVMGLSRYIGFIDGFKEGAAVTLEGYVLPSRNDNTRILWAQKMTFNGKDYDLGRPFMNMMPNMMPQRMMWGRW